ncbi:alpha/beta hydrolase family esterase [Pedobacter miscanthi]|uniref:alpha/beta hydrolase family esterase n=1 Tax=Pedobacter miscanthi TaxID=2259170 RepID=UPI00142D822B|nr:esterase [Pedobacter miscanthi]
MIRNITFRGFKSVLLILLLTCASVLSVFAQSASEVKKMRFMVGDTGREALVHIPNTAKTKASPLIFVFHGHGGTMENAYRSHQFEKLWPEAIIVYPQGLNTPGQLTDPQGKLPGWQKEEGDMNNRDLNFFDQMLKTLRTDYKIDDTHIYATGHSNGGGFTYLLWATRADVFAAFAPSSAVSRKAVGMLKPKPAMHIMGEQDPLVKPEWQRLMCNLILKVNSCDTQGKPFGEYATYHASKSGNPVILYVHPGGHVYPKEADEVVVKFFKDIKKP